MARIWSEEHKFNSWLRVEVAAIQAWAEMGVVPQSDADVIAAKLASTSPTSTATRSNCTTT